MASSRQIEHLERKHEENPEGLTFAPLANAYRNSGQPERAIEILMQGLEHHPEHAPARIVLGRCHLDLGDDDAAETAFAQVLDLDNENVVALKALADITERASRFEDAAQWLGYLLEADRNNEEAREQLERVNASKAIAEAAGGETAVEAPSPAVADATGAADADEPADLPEATAEESEPLTLDAPWGEAAESTVEPPPSAWEPPAIASEVTEGVSASGLEGPGGPSEDGPALEPADAAPAESAAEEDSGETDLGVSLDNEDDISLTPVAHNEFQAPDAAAGLSLQAGSENEFQVEQDGEGLELRASEDNEFQRRSDAELLRPSVEEDDAGEPAVPLEGSDTSPLNETAEPGSWFPPVREETPPTVAPDSGPDGTPEPLQAAWGPEHDAPAEPPFEESEPLPSTWGAAGDVEQEAQASEDEAADGLEVTVDEGSEIDVEPGSLLAGDTAEGAELPGEDLYPEVLGSEREEAPPIEVVPPAGAEPEPEPAFVATETMAEVYLSQGHRAEALEVYRALLQATPGDTRLSEKVSALEQELKGGVAAGTEATLEAGEGPRAGPGPSYAASATGGQTVKALFRGLLTTKVAAPAVSATPPEATPAQAGESDAGQETMGQPTRPAQDPLSLSAIFGEDTSPVPPALGGGAAKAEPEEGFSFDSFFGDPEGGSDSKRSSGLRPKGREDEEDLDQFQSWLQGLKG